MIIRQLPRQIYVPDNSLSVYFPDVGENVRDHRAKLKVFLAEIYKVCWCGCKFQPKEVPHMHEALVSKRDVQGWEKEWKILINTPFNCILLCKDCNCGWSGKSAPKREKVFEVMYNRHGIDLIRWLESLPYKVHPLKGLIAYYKNIEEGGTDAEE